MSLIRDRATCSKCNLNKMVKVVIDGICTACRAGYPPQDGPYVNPETGQEYWPGEPGDPLLDQRTSLDGETEVSDQKEPIGADNEMSPKRNHYDRSPLVSDDLQETLDSLVDEGLIEVISTRRDRPVYVITTAGLTALRELSDLAE